MMLKKMMLFFVALVLVHFNVNAANAGFESKTKTKYKRTVKADKRHTHEKAGKKKVHRHSKEKSHPHKSQAIITSPDPH